MASSAEVLLDTSASVPFLVTGHAEHRDVFAALVRRRRGLSGHAAFETMATLTRLPQELKVDVVTAASLVTAAFPGTVQLSARGAADLLKALPALDIQGGAVYDALVGAAAVEHNLPLVTRDRRAVTTYQKLGVRYELLV